MQRSIAKPASLVYRKRIRLDVLSHLVDPTLPGGKMNRDTQSVGAVGLLWNFTEKEIDDFFLIFPGCQNHGRIRCNGIRIDFGAAIDQLFDDIEMPVLCSDV